MSFLNWTANPCRICKLKRTVGVALGASDKGDPPEVRWFCREHVPPEFRYGELKGRRQDGK